MKKKPILFSTTMVAAILEARKTQTRRVCECQKYAGDTEEVWRKHGIDALIPKYQIGDLLWVREKFRYAAWLEDGTELTFEFADGEMKTVKFETRPDFVEKLMPQLHLLLFDEQDRWRPSIFMPRCASRITLEVTGVRCERLQEITEEDAKAEGVENIDAYRKLWDEINGKKRPWESNQWVMVYEFQRNEK